MGNYLVGILKDTPMLSVIGVAELMHTANSIGAENYRFLEPFTIVGDPVSIRDTHAGCCAIPGEDDIAVFTVNRCQGR